MGDTDQKSAQGTEQMFEKEEIVPMDQTKEEENSLTETKMLVNMENKDDRNLPNMDVAFGSVDSEKDFITGNFQDSLFLYTKTEYKNSCKIIIQEKPVFKVIFIMREIASSACTFLKRQMLRRIKVAIMNQVISKP